MTARAPKVPAVRPYFWAVKLLTTAMGESASDYLLGALGYLGLGIGIIGFVVTVWLQFRTGRYQPVPYWAAVSMVAVVGTMAADMIHGELGVPPVHGGPESGYGTKIRPQALLLANRLSMTVS